MGFLGYGAIAVLLWFTGHQVIDGTLGIGTLTGFLLYGVTIGASLATIASLYGQLREGTGAVARVAPCRPARMGLTSQHPAPRR